METLELEKAKSKANKNQKRLSIQDFLTLQGQSEEVFEYDNGALTTIGAMKNQERIIVSNIFRKFQQTKAYTALGELLPETDCWLTPAQMRRPDISFFTRAQIKESAEGKNPIPAFVIELISEYDIT
jgi:Uma2 family endonuclease